MAGNEEAIALYLECVREGGLSARQAKRLPPKFRKMLERNDEDGKFRLSARLRKTFSVALTGGVFDVIHPGHILTLTEARKKADVLVVVVATDKTVMMRKKRKPMHTATLRAQMVDSLKPVDLAIVGGKDMMEIFNRVKPDVLVFGYDQKVMKVPGARSVQIRKSNLHPMAKTSRLIQMLGT